MKVGKTEFLELYGSTRDTKEINKVEDTLHDRIYGINRVRTIWRSQKYLQQKVFLSKGMFIPSHTQ